MRGKRYIAPLLAFVFLFTGCAYHAEYVKAPDIPLYNSAIMFNNINYIPVLQFCDYYNLDWDWDLIAQKIKIKKGTKTVILRPDSSLAIADGKALDLRYPVEYKSGTAYIPVKTALFISEDVFGLRKPAPIKKYYRMQTIVLDPGHGGKDPGATKYGIKEKDIVLDVAKKLKRNLERDGFTVYLTRERDIFIPLGERAAFANRKNADLFVSIHANAARSSGAKGFEVFYLSEATDDSARALAALENASLKFEKGSSNQTVADMVLSENRRESREMAFYICNTVSYELGMKKRGVKTARFAVLKGTLMPAVLVEIGFLTNNTEAIKLQKSSFRQKIADAMADSIAAYRRDFERTNGFSG